LAPANALFARWRAAPKATRRCAAIVPLVLLLGAAFWLLRSDSKSDDSGSKAVVAALRNFEAAVRDRDVERVKATTTPQFYQAYLKLSGSASIFADSDPALALGLPIERKVEAVRVDNDSATIDATVKGTDAFNLDAVEVRLAREDGAWLVDGLGFRHTRTGGAQVVDVTMKDFSFEPNPLAVRKGSPVVFRTRNAGSQPHMLAIWAVPPGADMIKVIEATQQLPAGVERIVQGSTFAVGDEGDITVPGGFKPGRYMLTCFLSDITSEELVPHYDRGMLTEFEVK
jgi:hypothetical protein